MKCIRKHLLVLLCKWKIQTFLKCNWNILGCVGKNIHLITFVFYLFLWILYYKFMTNLQCGPYGKEMANRLVKKGAAPKFISSLPSLRRMKISKTFINEALNKLHLSPFPCKEVELVLGLFLLLTLLLFWTFLDTKPQWSRLDFFRGRTINIQRISIIKLILPNMHV